jgi:hypothetical protein
MSEFQYKVFYNTFMSSAHIVNLHFGYVLPPNGTRRRMAVDQEKKTAMILNHDRQ